jgi:hypothetical protein
LSSMQPEIPLPTSNKSWPTSKAHSNRYTSSAEVSGFNAGEVYSFDGRGIPRPCFHHSTPCHGMPTHLPANRHGMPTQRRSPAHDTPSSACHLFLVTMNSLLPFITVRPGVCVCSCNRAALSSSE